MTASDDLLLHGPRRPALTLVVYGTIIVTAALELMRQDVTTAGDAFSNLVILGIVLVSAHTYAAIVGHAVAGKQVLQARELRHVIRAEAPVAFSIVVPGFWVLLAVVGVMEIQTALTFAVWTTPLLLLIVGTVTARANGRSWIRAVALGTVGAAVGIITIIAEASLHH